MKKKDEDSPEVKDEDSPEVKDEDSPEVKDEIICLPPLIEKDEDSPEVKEKLNKLENKYNFYKLRKYLQLNTDEYIPIKIYIEVEDPVLGRKVKELVHALETTGAPEQFYLNKLEIDEDAYFSESYKYIIHDEQKKKMRDLYDNYDVEGLEELLKKEKLYP